MKYQEAVDLGLEEYIPDKPCARGHQLRKVVGRFCIECKEFTDNRYKHDPVKKEKAAKWQKAYRKKQGDAYRKYIKDYMTEYRKTDKHKAWVKNYYDTNISPKAKPTSE